jgi:murein DD-endopeptidase MepM/ murein hydrolase activator NlpD
VAVGVTRGKFWLFVLLLLVLGGGFLIWRQRQPPVRVAIEPAFTALGHTARAITVTLDAPAADLGAVEVRVVQQGQARPVLSEDLTSAASRSVRKPVTLDAASLKLQEGPAELEIEARDTLWRPRPPRGPRLVHRFSVDLTPPKLELKTATGYIKHAGAGIVVYRPEGAVRSGVRVGSEFFPGLAGLAQDPAVHVALFVIPYNGPEVAPSVVAVDEAGNERVIGVPVTFLPVRFPKDTINLTEAFLRRKVPELAPQTPGTASPEEFLQAFLRINGEGRKAYEAKNREIGRGETSPKPLWTGAFRQQPNTKVFANFPEERTYQISGRTVDTQWHLGIDLASNRQSPVEASNAGRVVFTGPNGIYGNIVIVDHGLGLMSLYAHLSDIAVKAGQAVQKGEALGRSGETGLAGGDHLHFALLIHGVYTSPIEWWDDHWLKDRIAKPLVDAGISLPGVTDGVSAAATTSGPTAPPPPAKRRPPRARR